MNDGHRNPLVSAELWGPGDFFDHVARRGTGEETRAYLFSIPPATLSALAQAYRFKLLRGELRGLALRLMARSPENGPDEADREPDVLENAESRRATAGVARLADIPPPVGGAYVRDFHLGGVQTEAMRGLVRRTKAAGVVPVLLDAPLSDWYRSGMIHGEEAAYLELLRRFGAEEDVAVFALPREAWGLGEDDYFVKDGHFDGHHVATPEGRRRFAETVGRLVVGPLWARLAAGEGVGFAQGRLETRP